MLKIRGYTQNPDQLHISKGITFNRIQSPGLKNLGYTFLEILAVLAILAILASFAIPKIIRIDESAEQEVINLAIKELNRREMFEWQKVKLSDKGWEQDITIFQNMDYDLEPAFLWHSEAKADGGRLEFKGSILGMKRIASTFDSPGKWVKVPL